MMGRRDGWVVVEIITMFCSHLKNPTKTNPGQVGTQTAEASQPLFTAHSIYHGYYWGDRARSALWAWTCTHASITRVDLGWGNCQVSLSLFFKHFEFRIRFPKHSEHLNPCVFWGKLDPHVSDSFTLNLSNCCFVRVIWCPRSFMRFFF